MEIVKQVASINPIQDGGGAGGGAGESQKGPTTSFPPVPSTNVRASPQNFLTFSFNSFPTMV